MTRGPHVRDNKLLDSLEAITPVAFHDSGWRAVRDGRDVRLAHASGDDGSFDVLYASTATEGALAEMAFHLRRGQPVIPSKLEYRLFEFTICVEKVLNFASLEALAAVGLDTSRYGALSCDGRTAEYPRSQEVGEAAHFLGFDGLIVPNARTPGRFTLRPETMPCILRSRARGAMAAEHLAAVYLTSAGGLRQPRCHKDQLLVESDIGPCRAIRPSKNQKRFALPTLPLTATCALPLRHPVAATTHAAW
jgi:hypothetical protein